MLQVASLVVATLFASRTVLAAPQAICGLHSQFLNTESGHTPCDIAAVLIGGGVKPADSPFPELMNMGVNRYPAPKAEEADDLRCNTLFYNLVSACGSCQGSKYTWVSWDEWTANCKGISSLSNVAQRLPNDLAIASWAYIPPSATNGTWNNAVAFTESTKNIPDSFFPKLSVTQSSACGSLPLTPGAIAGASVGGTVGLFVIGGLLFLLVSRKKRRGEHAPSVQTKVDMRDTASVNSMSKDGLRGL